MSSANLGSYLRILMVIGVGVIGIIEFAKLRRTNYHPPPKYFILFGIFIFYALFSTLYSIDKRYTFIRSTEFLFFFAFLLGLHFWLEDRSRLDRVLNIYFTVCAAGILINATALFMFPQRVWSWEMPDRFQGLFTHPNTFGAFCMISYPAILWKFRKTTLSRRIWVVFLFGITLTAHIMSGSRASLAASFFGFFVWVVFSEQAQDIRYIARIAAFILIGFFGVLFLLQHRPTSFQRGEGTSITTLSGRSEFWRDCLLLIREKPIQGYGYGVAGKVWEDPRFNRKGNFLWAGSARSSLHNGYLSIAIGLGLTGFLIWAGVLAVPVSRVIKLEPSVYKSFVLAMVSQALLINFFESYISAGSQLAASLVFWLAIIVGGRMPELLGSQTQQTYIAVPALRGQE